METHEQTKQEMTESLYVELDGSDQIPLTTLSVIFLHQFCACSNYNVIQVDTKDKPSQPLNTPSQPIDEPSHLMDKPRQPVKTNNNKSNTALHFPAHIESSFMKWSELPDVVKSCALPAIVDAQEVVCYTGLCTVLRRIVMTADLQHPLKNLISLLGFRQTNLKTCSEVSPWTKLCEVQAPKDIADFLNECNTYTESAGNQVTCIPEAVQVFEDYLSQPVNVFNAVYRQQRLRKSDSTTDDINTKCKQLSGNSGPCLDAAYKNDVIIKDKRKYKQSLHAGRINQDSALVTEKSSKHNDVALPLSKLSLGKDSNSSVTKESTSGINSCTDREELFAEKALEERKKEMSLGENSAVTAASSMDNKLKTELNDHNSKKSEKKSHSKKHCTEELLPPLEHTFAEGPDLTLADIALFPYIHIFLTLLNWIGCSELCRTIPFVLRWYKNMLNVPNVMETALLCGLTVLELPNEKFVDSTVAKAKQKADNQEPVFGKGKSR